MPHLKLRSRLSALLGGHKGSQAPTAASAPDASTAMASRIGNSNLSELLSSQSSGDMGSPSASPGVRGSAAEQTAAYSRPAAPAGNTRRGAKVHPLDLSLDQPVSQPAAGPAPAPKRKGAKVYPADAPLEQPVSQSPSGQASTYKRKGAKVHPFGDAVNQELEQTLKQRANGVIQQAAAAPQATADQEDGSPAMKAGTQKFSSFVQLRDRLVSSERTGFGNNSSYFDAVSSATDNIVTQINTPLTGDPKADQDAFNHLVSAYSALLSACDAYNARTALSSKGKARQDIVKQIRDQAISDFSHLRMYADRLATLPPDQRPRNLLEALGSARTRVLTLRSGKEQDVKHVGGAVSHLAVLKKGMLTDKDASGFFKAEDVLSPNLSDKEAELVALETMRQRMPRFQDIATEAAMLALESNSSPNMEASEASSFRNTRKAHLFQGEKMSISRARNTAINNLAELGAPTSGKINVSNRNVATSRMANLLGIGDLVAQSERAELHDADGKHATVGNLMQPARGEEAASFLQKQYQDEAIAATPESNFSSTRGVSVKLHGMERHMTPEFMQSITSLQVLDNIVGQGDRHTKNYFVEALDGGKMGKVHAIDNDFSFGTHDITGDQTGRIGTYGHSIVDKSGKLKLSHMDKALADRILALNMSDVRLMMADVLEDWAIDALCKRLTALQQAIRQAQEEDTGGKRFLSDLSQWDDEVMTALKGDTSNPETYIGDLFSSAEGNDASRLPAMSDYAFGEFRDEIAEEENAKFWSQLKGMQTKEEKLAWLTSHGLPQKYKSYFEKYIDQFTGDVSEIKDRDVQFALIDGLNRQAVVERLKKEKEKVLQKKTG